MASQKRTHTTELRTDFSPRLKPLRQKQPQMPPPKLPNIGRSAGTRGTVLLFNDWGEFFGKNKTLLAALKERGFCVTGYNWFLRNNSGKNRKKRLSKRRKSVRYRRLYACCFNNKTLSVFLDTVLLTKYPPPFYVLAQGMGALFALSAQNILHSAISRMIVLSVPMSVNNHKPHSLYHFSVKTLSYFTPQYTAAKITAQNSFAYKATLLDSASYILSEEYQSSMSIPCLIITDRYETKTDIMLTRLLAEKLRLADIISVSAPLPVFSKHSVYQTSQFWIGFDKFIAKK